MGNQLSSLPKDVDSFLMDMAQTQEGFDYTDIIDFAAVATSQQIQELRLAASDLADLDFEIDEDPEALNIFQGIVNLVKGEKAHA